MKKIFFLFVSTLFLNYSFCIAQNLPYQKSLIHYRNELKKFKEDEPEFYKILRKISYINPDESQKILDNISSDKLNNKVKFDYHKTKLITLLHLSNFDLALQTAHDLINIAEKNNHVHEKVIAYLLISECYLLKYQFKEAKLFALKALSLTKNGKEQQSHLRTLIQLAKVNYFEKNYSESLENINTALKILEFYSDDFEASKLYTTLANIQKEIGNNDLAIYYFHKAIQLDEKNHNYVSLSKNLGFIALLYYQEENYSRALEINQKGLSIAKWLNNKFSIVNKLITQGNCLLKLNKNLEAFQAFKEADSIAKNFNLKTSFVWCRLGMMDYYLKTQNFTSALNIIQSIESLVDSLNQNEIKIKFYKLCAQTYANLGDYKKAYTYFNKFYLLNENDLKQELKNKISQYGVIFKSELQTKENEFIKKENEIISKQNQLQKIIIFLIIFLLILSLVFLGYALKQKKQLYEQNLELKRKNEEIFSQQEELLAQNEIVKAQNEQLQAINKYKSQLFALMTHDLKTPIANLQMLLTILEKKNISNNDLNEYIQEIKNEVDNSYELIQNLILWTKSQLSNLEPKFKIFYLQTIVNKRVSFFESNLKRKNIQLDIQIDENLMVWADEQLLGHIIHNILSNAIKFSYPNSIIKIYASIIDKNVVLSIQNFGKPIPKEQLNQIFEINITPEVGTFNEMGSGFGLYLSSEFMKKMEGKITCTSDNKSTVFSIYIPMADD